mgnify:FL=1
MNFNNYIKFFFIGLIVVLSNSFYIVDESEQAIVTQFGKPVGGAKVTSGLYFKLERD